MTRFTCTNCGQEIVGSLPCLTCYLRPDGQPVLTMLPAEPKAPSRSEMEEAIVAWGRHPDHVLTALRDPTDIALWGLSNRLEAFPLNPDAAQKRADEGPRRNWSWVATDEFSEPCARATCSAATDATHYHRPCGARGVDSGRFPDNSGISALARARITLQHINDWATMDPAAEPFGWIANETAAALGGQPDPLYAALRRWVVARKAEVHRDGAITTRELDRLRMESDSADEALFSLARSVLGVEE